VKATAGSERRRSRRYDIALPVEVRTPVAGGPARETRGETKDISARGLYFVIDQDLTPGSELEFTLVLPREITGESEVLVRAQGRVIRVIPQTDGGANRIGVAAMIEKYEMVRAEIPSP